MDQQKKIHSTNRIIFLLKFFSQDDHNAPGVFFSLPHSSFLAMLFWHFLNGYPLPPFHNEPFIEFHFDIPLPKHVRDNDSNRKLSFFSSLSIVLLQRKGLWVIARLCAHSMCMSIVLAGYLMTSGFLAFNLKTSQLWITTDRNALKNILWQHIFSVWKWLVCMFCSQSYTLSGVVEHFSVVIVVSLTYETGTRWSKNENSINFINTRKYL